MYKLLLVQDVHMRCEQFYSAFVHELKVKNWVGHVFKFWICASLISLSFHPQHYIHSAQNGVTSRKGKVYAVVSRGKVCDYCAQLVSEKEVISGIIFFRVAAFVKERPMGKKHCLNVR